MQTNTWIGLTIIALAALILAFWRFSGGRFGELRPSREATEAYTAFRVDPDKIYYSSGSDVYPNALMGIDRSWALESDLWKKRELTDLELKEIVMNMQSRAMEWAPLQGFDIVDDRGWKIGDWYSILGLSIAIEVVGEKRVVITTPPIDTYPQS
jgi:hypothetical protein